MFFNFGNGFGTDPNMDDYTNNNANNEDYYKILGIDEKAGDDEIRKSYRRLSMIHHPDKNGVPYGRTFGTAFLLDGYVCNVVRQYTACRSLLYLRAKPLKRGRKGGNGVIAVQF